MLSLELIRKDPALVKTAMLSKGEDDCIDTILELDSQRREAVTEGDELRAKRNEVSRAIGQARSSGESPSEKIVEEMRQVGDKIDRLEETVRQLDTQINEFLMGLPNIPRSSALQGDGEEDNRVTRSWGDPRDFEFTPLAHWDIGENLGIIDFQRGAKLSGSRFYTMS